MPIVASLEDRTSSILWSRDGLVLASQCPIRSAWDVHGRQFQNSSQDRVDSQIKKRGAESAALSHSPLTKRGGGGTLGGDGEEKLLL